MWAPGTQGASDACCYTGPIDPAAGLVWEEKKVRTEGSVRHGIGAVVAWNSTYRMILECVSENSLPIHQEFIADSSA
jgi:hypothetical protein